MRIWSSLIRLWIADMAFYVPVFYSTHPCTQHSSALQANKGHHIFHSYFFSDTIMLLSSWPKLLCDAAKSSKPTKALDLKILPIRWVTFPSASSSDKLESSSVSTCDSSYGGTIIAIDEIVLTVWFPYSRSHRLH